MRAINLVYLYVSIFLLAGCNYKMQKIPTDNENIPVISKDQISFALVKKYVFEPKCIACHLEKAQLDVGNYLKVNANLNAIENDVLIRQTMPKPPASPLTEQEKQILQLWIAAGAPEFAGGGGEANPAPPILPTFASIKSNIFEVKCSLCHNPNGKAKNVPLDTIDDLTGGLSPYVEAGNPEGSYLTIVISLQSRKPMPPLDSGVARVTDSELKIIKEWIQNGAKD